MYMLPGRGSVKAVLTPLATVVLLGISAYANALTAETGLSQAIQHHSTQQRLQHYSLNGFESLLTTDQRSLNVPQQYITVRDVTTQQHNSSTISYVARAKWQNQWYQLLLTENEHGSIGELRSFNRHVMLLQQDGELYMFDVAQGSSAADLLEGDVPSMPQTGFMPRSFAPTTVTYQGQQITVVDIMMLYASEVTEHYPNGLATTLMHHLVAKTNQAFADSDLAVQLRLVHAAEVNYTQPSNFSAIDDLRDRLQGKVVTRDAGSLANVRAWREQYGADLVAMIRTHDLNEREVCGVAYYPQSVPDVVINISNVGSSGGSSCVDTFTHEIGHNFGAGHQYVEGQTPGTRPYAGALVVPGKFNTIMSSIGSGDDNRNYKLTRFSNPTQRCGGRSCGSILKADNVSAISEFATFNSSLRESSVTSEITPFQLQAYDTDNDGVSDEWDAFPHHATETADSDNDGVGDNADAFPNDSAESVDTDGDGIGNNSDPDDDNDGVPDNLDKLPLNPTYSADADGDGVADELDALPNNIQDYQDADSDKTANRFDNDNDNDGVTDFDSREDGAQQLLVLNAGNGNLSAYSLSGEWLDTLYTAPEGSLTFRSDLADIGAGQLAFIQSYDVMRLDRHNNNVDMLLHRSRLATRFPSHLLMHSNAESFKQSSARLVVSDGLKPSYLEQFMFNSDATVLQQRLPLYENVVRDMLLLSDGRILLALRDVNQLVTVRLTPQGFAEPVQWAQGPGLDKPEQLALLKDGSVLVTNAGSRDVSRFSGSGQFMSVFIPNGTAGLGMPGCIGVDNKNDVYLCNTDKDEILKFTGNNGAPQGVLLSAENGNIDNPVALLLVGSALDVEPFNPLNDSDGDGVANKDDAYPLDASRSVQPDPVEPTPGSSSGGVMYNLLLLLLLMWASRMMWVKHVWLNRVERSAN